MQVSLDVSQLACNEFIHSQFCQTDRQTQLPLMRTARQVNTSSQTVASVDVPEWFSLPDNELPYLYTRCLNTRQHQQSLHPPPPPPLFPHTPAYSSMMGGCRVISRGSIGLLRDSQHTMQDITKVQRVQLPPCSIVLQFLVNVSTVPQPSHLTTSNKHAKNNNSGVNSHACHKKKIILII